MNTSIVDPRLSQQPPPGRHLLKTRGGTVAFILTMGTPVDGQAWLRSNIGHGSVSRNEIVRSVERDAPILASDWFDRPMERIDNRRFRIVLALTEVGHFEAKCFFLPKGASTPVWPEGGNTIVNVEPAFTCCGNIIYNAFVRQFGPNRDGSAEAQWQALNPEPLDKAGFAVIPPSGKFRDLIRELDFIIFKLGCTIIQLLPIHPTPTTYARMGRFGSPYAALSFTEVDPALAEFDPAATPLEQFQELVDAVHARGARLFLDIAINHTGWAARLHGEHPEWLMRDPHGNIEVPGAWGVNWEDLTRLDYRCKNLWIYMAEVFLTWCRRGVDGFRCDAGYMIPESAWTYIVARVRDEFPDTVFFLEGLGGKISVTRQLLNRANLNWTYSELFQNYDRSQIEHYLPESIDISGSDGLTVHFAETHDNPRLAARSKTWARLRIRLCALFSPWGAFAFANGVEWFATEKINVHQSPSLNWGSAENQVEDISLLCAVLKTHPAFREGTRLEMIQEGEGNALILLRHHHPTGKRLLILANLDEYATVTAAWHRERSGLTAARFVDLMTSRAIAPARDGARFTVPLDPGEVLCLSPDPRDLQALTSDIHSRAPARALHQRLRAKAMEVAAASGQSPPAEAVDWDRAAAGLSIDPVAFCRKMNPDAGPTMVIRWQWPKDARREVMVPPRHFLLVRSPHPFRCRLTEGHRTLRVEECLPWGKDAHFALIPPMNDGGAGTRVLELSVFEPGRTHHAKTPVRYLSAAEDATVRHVFSGKDLQSDTLLFLGTNGRGGMCRALARWGELRSRYDALLAANLSEKYPEDRRVLLTRIRCWSVYQGYSQVFHADCTDSFAYAPEGARWRFRLPCGQGESVRLRVDLTMVPGRNALRMTFLRETSSTGQDLLVDDRPVEIILRPDVEDRSFHETTKAFTGPEHSFPRAVTVRDSGFRFSPQPPAGLDLSISKGRFTLEPEWHYMVHRPQEAERGLDPDSDLFSPGFFLAILRGGDSVTLEASADGESVGAPAPPDAGCSTLPAPNPETALLSAMDAYVVRRGEFSTVIAGYPWFLDWGRDTLIFVRGLIAAGRLETARAIVRQFAEFEENGTLPNMIRGLDAGNRDTSDAPLWLAVVCSDLAVAEGGFDLLKMTCGKRSLGRVLSDMARSLMEGSPNGIRMDPASGLLFSPAHFTWMDTNHPAGTPRQGYPVEIAALWYATLRFLAESRNSRGPWRTLSRKVQKSIRTLFLRTEEGYLSDCLHAESGCPAERAEPDNALRPNQLLAVTLGAVEDTAIRRRIVHACEELVVPGGIRSLADRPLSRPLEIMHDGRTLVDPFHPYQGRYRGDEDTRRKPAYHNGTAWTWIFPSFCEAWALTYGARSASTALAWLASGVPLINSGCVGHLPEILEGDIPHEPVGCDAQAWSASEFYRVWRLLRRLMKG
ncbi:MAG: amylo-alpha-1,6-glucosidase [Desulfobacterales bacterium]